MLFPAVNFKIRSMFITHNHFLSCPNIIYMQISSGDIEHSITFWSKFSVILSSMTLKIRVGEGYRVLIKALACPSVVSVYHLLKIRLFVQEMLSIISFFDLNLACFCLQ